jgi:hypothetical protein
MTMTAETQRKVGHLFDGMFSIMTESFPSKVTYKTSAKVAIALVIR